MVFPASADIARKLYAIAFSVKITMYLDLKSLLGCLGAVWDKIEMKESSQSIYEVFH